MGNNDPCADLKTRIPALPRIMRAHNWSIGAALMEDWLHRGANDNPENVTPNIDSVRMDWVLTFKRAKVAYDSAVSKKVWVNEKARAEIVKNLVYEKKRLPSVVDEKLEIGNVGEDLWHRVYFQSFHKKWQVQLIEVRQNPITEQLDGLYAALGDFSFYYLVKGWVERLPDQGGKPRYKVTINKVGVYVRDSYDFNDYDPNKPTPNGWRGWFLKINAITSQPLGIWACTTNYAGKVPWKDRYYVQNRDFREWRAKHGKGYGGDFMVFSDIKVFDTNDSFEF